MPLFKKKPKPPNGFKFEAKLQLMRDCRALDVGNIVFKLSDK